MTRPFSFLLLLLAPAWSAPADAEKFYAEKVHPILASNCFECHGEKDKLRGGLRLTSQAGLRKGGDLGPAIDETNLGASLLLRMISYQDDEHQMPPKAKLRESDAAVLRQWVGMGAPYDPALEIHGKDHAGFAITAAQREHWAYRHLVEPAVPGNRGGHPIDAFLDAKLKSAGLTRNGPAEAEPLARRLHYNLTGLPPTLEEVRSFADQARREGLGRAVAARVDLLLASPAYGEHWARHWLDLVRYAESNGFERDNPKPHIWRYRDYVVEAFHADRPYDRFIIEQLAGDEMPEVTQASLTATGYHRLMQWDDEPADGEQHRYDVLADNVQVTAETFLGTTLGCARCHDHKADPFSQRDYYSFMAFFHGVTPYQTAGSIVPWASGGEKMAFEAARAQRLSEAKAALESLDGELAAWLKETGRLGGKPMKPMHWVDDAQGAGAEWSYTTQLPVPDWKETSFRPSGWSKGRGGFGMPQTPGAIVRTEWQTPEIWLVTSFGLDALPEDLSLRLHHDEDVEVYLNGTEIYRAKGYLTEYTTVPLGEVALKALQTGRNTLAVHCLQRGGGQYIDVSLRSGIGGFATVAEALREGREEIRKAAQARFGRDMVKQRQDLTARIEAIQKEVPGIPLNAVQETRGEVRPLHIHLRGSAHALGTPVEPAFPAVLASPDANPPVPASVGKVEREGATSSGRRLALARWMASGDNPLTARVMVNRIWQHHFGRGIVPSSNDFGQLGEDPTHPELLDYLASRFIASGWSVKAMHRLILTSEAAQMSSAGTPQGLARDPSNELFWRANMRRLTAEEIRDSILAVTGKLNASKTGGPSVFPPLPPEVLATSSRPGANWPVSPDPADHVRRSLYIHVKRSLRHPFLADFDQADTDSPCAVRFATTVPTQALAMLNSGFTNQQAALLGERLWREEPDLESRVRSALRLVTQREPEAKDERIATELVRRLQSVGSLDERAALDHLALLALNLNEFVHLD
ncbi:MAG: Protein of unknown function DUF1553/DUF1549/Planctomycete cytochrome C [Verrucomicrobia bacterium]|nr:MAG: Protein of unknown function DUF1553/DUF1549/Planctomycete cytochrome C [Verrucomicrobiota bacterium]